MLHPACLEGVLLNGWRGCTLKLWGTNAVQSEIIGKTSRTKLALFKHLHVLKISDNVEIDEDEPNLFLFTGIHAREILGVELNLYSAERILVTYDTDPAVKELVDNNQIYILMTANPDGFHHMWNIDSAWRKNRRPNEDGSFGVDMNRNYPMAWDLDFCKGSDVQSSNNYRGPSAASEPETQTIVAFHSDRNFDRVFDFHTGCGPDVRYNYATDFMLPEEIDSMGIGIAAELGDLMGIASRRALNCGTHPSFAYNNRGTLSFLSEISLPHQPPPAAKDEVLETSCCYRFFDPAHPYLGLCGG